MTNSYKQSLKARLDALEEAEMHVENAQNNQSTEGPVAEKIAESLSEMQQAKVATEDELSIFDIDWVEVILTAEDIKVAYENIACILDDAGIITRLEGGGFSLNVDSDNLDPEINALIETLEHQQKAWYECVVAMEDDCQ